LRSRKLVGLNNEIKVGLTVGIEVGFTDLADDALFVGFDEVGTEVFLTEGFKVLIYDGRFDCFVVVGDLVRIKVEASVVGLVVGRAFGCDVKEEDGTEALADSYKTIMIMNRTLNISIFVIGTIGMEC
jgi:hypothetical protein